MKLEICANSYASAINAEQAGAHRIELCQELQIGGITPSFGLIKQVVNALSIPVYVLIRPRSGHFVYSEEELKTMLYDIEACRDLGVKGIVSGALLSNNEIDKNSSKRLLSSSRGMDFTFHRAFDAVNNQLNGLDELKTMGIKRVLTSGGASRALMGLENLKLLLNHSESKITIMPGSGINATNVGQFKKAGFTEIHASASKVINPLENENDLFSSNITVSSISNIKALLQNISENE
ncbi:MAG: copper homeostasis protein CutC [Bacteroidetes bacterium MedPE-SWsnd-G2]|nr:MAG: copper homeostasis protein CutC [Bacteroidetes bacterium MedPE-SWsnd-G2]